VLRLGLSGIHSVEILANDSATQEQLANLLRSVHPILEVLNNAIGAYNAESVAGGS